MRCGDVLRLSSKYLAKVCFGTRTILLVLWLRFNLEPFLTPLLR